jgi:von Willebrand factor type A domain-containing protein
LFRSFSWAALFVSILLFSSICWSQAQQQRLEFASDLKLVDCWPASSVPCFRGSLNILDAQGMPAALDLQGQSKLAVTNIKVTADDVPVTVFYAGEGSTTQSAHGRIALILVDISGSMNRRLKTGETRFEAAHAALEHFLETFQDGVDQVAIVPFESHRVEQTVREASFATTRNAAAAQVASLPLPQSTNNTALYSAVAFALDVLSSRVNQQASEAMLVVMTDGKNEVLPGDDPGLLDGEPGLAQVERKIAASQLPVIGIGFGETNEVDENALRRLSTRPPSMAPDAAALRQIFSFTRKLLVNRINVAFLSPRPDRASLAGQSIKFQAQLTLPNRDTLVSNPVLFGTPQMGPPLIYGKASTEELQGLNSLNQAPTGPGWLTLLRPLFVFLGLGGLLLIAWFGIPRLIWPGQYIGNVATAKPAIRWSGPTPPAKKAPPGFDHSRSIPSDRRPQDATVIRPVSDVTKTRLQQDWKK